MAKRGSRLILLLVIGITALVYFPTLSDDFSGDDIAQLSYLKDPSGPHGGAFRNSFDLYDFFDGNAARVQEDVHTGSLPWWTDPSQKLCHFRPLSSALMAIEVRLVGASPFALHLHSLLWLVALLLVVSAVYRRICVDDTASIVSICVFAAMPYAETAVTWWCCRNGLVSAVLGMLGLLGYVAWRERRPVLGVAAGALGVELALLGGEVGYQIAAFLIVFALSDRRKRRTAVALFSAVVALHTWLRAVMGGGAFRSGYYIDPLREPLRYFRNVLDVLVGIARLREGLYVAAFFGALIVSIGAVATAKHRKEYPGWLCWATAVSLLPCFGSTGFLRPWTLIVPSIGLAYVIGSVLVDLLKRATDGPRGNVIRRAWILVFATAALVFGASPVVRFVRHERTARAAASRHITEENDQRISTALHEHPARRLVILWQGDVDPLLPALRFRRPDIALDTLWTLSNGRGVTLARTSSNTLVATSKEDVLAISPAWRAESVPLQTGDEIDLGGLDVRIVHAAKDRVLAVEYRFDDSVDDPSFVFMAERNGLLTRVDVPRVGETMRGDTDP